jgi:hypothetical protein
MYTTETNKTARRTDGGKVVRVQELVSRTAPRFGVIPIFYEKVKGLNPVNVDYIYSRITQLHANRSRMPEHGQAAEFVQLANQAGVSFDQTVVWAFPEQVLVTDIAQTTATVNWGDVLITGYNDVRYESEIRKVSDDSVVKSATGLVPSQYLATGLTAATNYKVRVRANWRAGASTTAWSAYTNFTTLT